MNQILACEKIYVTRDMKKKKVFFKIEFILSIFLVCILSSYGIYAAYDRNKSEQVSKEILGKITFEKPEEKLEKVVVVLNSAFQTEQELTTVQEIEDIPAVQVVKANDGSDYYTIGTIRIPCINVDYPILSETTPELLKKAPCKFWGADPNRVGNFCVAGHNYRNTKFFSKVPTLNNGDIIEITDLSNQTLQYAVYDKHTVDPENVSDTAQETNGRREITIITCTDDSKQRVIVKAREI